LDGKGVIELSFAVIFELSKGGNGNLSMDVD